jgi:hypothetical protein
LPALISPATVVSLLLGVPNVLAALLIAWAAAGLGLGGLLLWGSGDRPCGVRRGIHFGARDSQPLTGCENRQVLRTYGLKS